MADIETRIEGKAGRITLTRPQSLNALTWEMCLAIETALDAWRNDDTVGLVLLEGEGDRAFCAGGDVQKIYEAGRRGDFDYGRAFWADEYRLNTKIKRYPKPIVSFLHGYVLGGGVGIGCHGSHRIVGESARVSMPECGLGLIPDVGGTFILSRAPGRMGEYLGTTGVHLNAADAIYAGFADYHVPESGWAALKSELVRTANPALIGAAAETAQGAGLPALQTSIDKAFARETPVMILATLPRAAWAEKARAALLRGSPLSIACTLELVRTARTLANFEDVIAREYRFTFRGCEQAEFLEGIRAQVVDKDRKPKWALRRFEDVSAQRVQALLAPLGERELNLRGGTT